MIAEHRQFTRAVFTAFFNPASIWILRNGSFFSPQSSMLTMVLLPSGGPGSTFSFSPGESWDITVDSINDPIQSEAPEPATMTLAGAALAGAMAISRLRKR